MTERWLSVINTRGHQMSIKLNWERLKEIHAYLTNDLDQEDELSIVMFTQSGRTKKSLIKFKDFLNFCWAISDNPDYVIIGMIIQDKSGRVVYRHNKITEGNEEIPIGGNSNVIQNWNALIQHEKDVYIKLMIAQINAQQQSS